MLVDMVQLLFARLPQFKEEIKYSAVKKANLDENAFITKRFFFHISNLFLKIAYDARR
jgi:hypothetical protein